jgi:hypothetical protein
VDEIGSRVNEVTQRSATLRRLAREPLRSRFRFLSSIDRYLTWEPSPPIRSSLTG